MSRLRIALAQLNVIVGDLDGNVDRIIAAMAEAERQGSDLVAFPELAITGYPPEDLLLKPAFIADNKKALQRVIDASGRAAVVVGISAQNGSSTSYSVFASYSRRGSTLRDRRSACAPSH